METAGVKRQAAEGETMATSTENVYLHNELENRRQKLLEATRANSQDSALRELLANVDRALERLQAGSYGICEQCHESIEADRLLSDPLVRFCLDHLSEEEQRALERDLSLAARIQRTLLPRSDWSGWGWQARYHYQPARHVSGDYCDLIDSDGSFLFLLGDVAGKGVAASMLMSHLHATFRSLAGQKLPLGELVGHANRLFSDSTTAGQFATMIVGRAHTDGRVEYVSAGHLPLLHVSCDGVRAWDSTCVPLGMFCTANYAVSEVTLAPGDKLFLYTDGLTEIFNAAGDEFGVSRVRNLAAQHAKSEPDALLAACLKEIKSFSSSEKQPDDLTLLVLHRECAGAKGEMRLSLS